MTGTINISDAYLNGLFSLSDEEKISLATRLLNSLKGSFNVVGKKEHGSTYSFRNLKGALSGMDNADELYDEYITEKYGI